MFSVSRFNNATQRSAAQLSTTCTSASARDLHNNTASWKHNVCVPLCGRLRALLWITYIMHQRQRALPETLKLTISLRVYYSLPPFRVTVYSPHKHWIHFLNTFTDIRMYVWVLLWYKVYTNWMTLWLWVDVAINPFAFRLVSLCCVGWIGSQHRQPHRDSRALASWRMELFRTETQIRDLDVNMASTLRNVLTIGQIH